MANPIKRVKTSWSICWIYTKEEWGSFEKWNAKRKGMLSYLRHAFFHKKDRCKPCVELTEQWVKIGDKRKYFTGPVTQLRRVDIYDKKQFNIMSISYEILSKSQLNEIHVPIPKGKLKEAIEAQEKLMSCPGIL